MALEDIPSVRRFIASAAVPERPRVLLVEDEARLQLVFHRILSGAGFEVDVATDGHSAVEKLLVTSYCALISDVMMPNMSGLELLRFVRVHDLDVPVLLMSGALDMNMATEAIGHGAFQLLSKPIAPALLVSEVTRASKVHALSAIRRQAMRLLEVEALDEEERRDLRRSFQSTLDTLWMAFQPVVSPDGTLFGYEALLRSDSTSLKGPLAVIAAAEKLSRLSELGRVTRERAAADFAGAAPGVSLFVNLHTRDILDDALLAPDSKLLAIANRVVLEITERASLDTLPNAVARVARLREAGFRIAVDDLGSGYSGLSSFMVLKPELVKLDMTLIRDIDTDKMKSTLVRMMVNACRDMGILVVAEGVETRQERDALTEMGCDLYQGYLIAKPGRPFPGVTW